MSISCRSGSVCSRASSTVTPGISPTVSRPSRPAKTSRYISWRNSCSRGPPTKPAEPSAYADPADNRPSGSGTTLEIMLITSIRKPSTPRSSHQRIIV